MCMCVCMQNDASILRHGSFSITETSYDLNQPLALILYNPYPEERNYKKLHIAFEFGAFLFDFFAISFGFLPPR